MHLHTNSPETAMVVSLTADEVAYFQKPSPREFPQMKLL